MTKMRNIWRWGLIITMLFGCSTITSTRPVCEWRNPEYKGGAFNNILIVGVAKKEAPRCVFENAFVDSLKQEQVDATASLSVIPSKTKPTEKNIREAVKNGNYDAVLITHLVSVQSEKISPAPEAVNSYYNYYHSVNDEALPSYTAKTVKLKTNIFDVKTEKLVWTMQSATINPGSRDALIQSEIKTIVKLLKKENLLGVTK